MSIKANPAIKSAIEISTNCLMISCHADLIRRTGFVFNILILHKEDVSMLKIQLMPSADYTIGT